MKASNRVCKGCPLIGNCKVWGEGNSSSHIVFVGRNPGTVEVQRGRPFVGPAGLRLDKVFDEIALQRSSIWLTNLVKCFTLDNAKPPAEAAEHCWGYLQVEIAKAKLIVAIGDQAQKFLLEHLPEVNPAAKLFPIIHPSAALRKGIFEARLRRDTRLLRKELEVWQTHGRT